MFVIVSKAHCLQKEGLTKSREGMGSGHGCCSPPLSVPYHFPLLFQIYASGVGGGNIWSQSELSSYTPTPTQFCPCPSNVTFEWMMPM